MRCFYYIWIVLAGLGLWACQDDWDEPGGAPGDRCEGMVSFSLSPAAGEVVVTRADAPQYDEKEAVENVYLLVFDQAANKIYTAYQELVENNTMVSLYLTREAFSVYAVCNLPDTALLTGVTNVSELNDTALEIGKPHEAYPGSFVMAGWVEVRQQADDLLKSSYDIPLTRLAAELRFAIQKHLPEGDQFEISAVYLHAIPKGSKLLEQPYPAGEDDTLAVATGDYVYDTDPARRANRYFRTPAPDEKPDSLWLDFSVNAKTGATEAACFQFENRQGGLVERKLSDGTIDKEDKGSYWKPIAGLQDDDYLLYRQIYKGGFGRKLFPYASYLTIHGIYRTKYGTPFKVVYDVYLGSDNYKDFNVRRNHSYLYEISIRSKDMLDTRVHTTDMGNIEIEGNFNNGKILDAHCNVMQALMYASGSWTVRVEDPDRTPWLELSRSKAYLPRMVGDADNGDRASYRLSGPAGLSYFYIHTDEYVPEIERPGGNNSLPDPQDGLPPNIRTGKIICETSSGGRKEIEIRQYAAQMVVLHIKYDVHTMKEIRDTFYVERVLEEKNLTWGFDHYWSFITDDLIASGQWDGLSNTRKLYQVALDGDKWGVDPAYPDGRIPSDIALGYTLSKNRDRNGNGVIDYNEIMWYLPAVNELQALCEAVNSPLDDDDLEWIAPDDKNTVWLDEEQTVYHSSTPSVADPSGITPGRSYYMNFKKLKRGIGLRTRKCNVICCRRKNAWKGPDSGVVDGDVIIDPDWSEEEEEIMPKN